MAGIITRMIDHFDYYKAPEGEDPINKIMGLAKNGILVSGFLTLYDACLYSRCTNTPQFLNCAGYWFVPITGMCLAFSTVTYIANHVRQKDDVYNYMLGAFSSGAVLHAWQKHPMISGWGTFLFVCYSVCKYHAVKAGDRNVFFMTKKPVKWQASWRNVYYRDYTCKPKYEFVKDYY